MSREQIKEQGGGIDPYRYRGKVKLIACLSPAFDADGRKFDSGDPHFDGVRVPREQVGEMLDYGVQYYRGDHCSYGEDFVLVRLKCGREYWYEWSEIYFTKGEGES